MLSSSIAISTCREISPASPPNYHTRGYEGVCELMFIPDNGYAKKKCIIRCHITPGRTLTDLGVTLVIVLNF